MLSDKFIIQGYCGDQECRKLCLSNAASGTEPCLTATADLVGLGPLSGDAEIPPPSTQPAPWPPVWSSYIVISFSAASLCPAPTVSSTVLRKNGCPGAATGVHWQDCVTCIIHDGSSPIPGQGSSSSWSYYIPTASPTEHLQYWGTQSSMDLSAHVSRSEYTPPSANMIGYWTKRVLMLGFYSVRYTIRIKYSLETCLFTKLSVDFALSKLFGS